MKILIIVDSNHVKIWENQNDFCNIGSLAVPDAEEIIKPINDIMKDYDIVIATKDSHPKDHYSFSKWPKHCVKGTFGEKLHKDLDSSKIDKTLYKGECSSIESYSGLFDENGLANELYYELTNLDIDYIDICGLALDYCVKETALDCAFLGYNTRILVDLCKSIGDKNKICKELKEIENLTLLQN